MSKPINWRERHKQIKEWNKQKKIKQKQKTNEMSDEWEQQNDNNIEIMDDSINESIEQSLDDINSSGRKWTASIAVPSSIVDNAQSPELKAYLCGQIARSLVIFQIDEIIIFDEYSKQTSIESNDNSEPNILLYDKRNASMVQMIKILQYLECPQYLRKYVFPIQKDLQFAGLLNPLDSTHHLKTEDFCQYREGVVTNRTIKKGKGSFVYIGLQNDVQIDKTLKPNIRVTVKLSDTTDHKQKKLKGIAVSPSEPRTKAGLYWGYTIRAAKSLSAVFTETPFDGGYDLTIGTSDKGQNIDRTLRQIPKQFNHLLIVFGGLKGLEAAHDSDEFLSSVEDTRDLFNYYLNTCPEQGSNTIRTEEAILITLSALRKRLFTKH